MGVFFYIQKGLPIRAGPGIAYEHLLKEQSDAQKVVSSMQKPVYERILKEQRDAQNSVSNGGADRKLLIKEKALSNGCLFYIYESNSVFVVGAGAYYYQYTIA